MRTYVQYGLDGRVIAQVSSATPPDHPRQIDVTERQDGPWIGTIYTPGNDTFTAVLVIPHADDRDALAIARRNHVDLAASPVEMARMMQLLVKKLYGVTE